MESRERGPAAFQVDGGEAGGEEEEDDVGGEDGEGVVVAAEESAEALGDGGGETEGGHAHEEEAGEEEGVLGFPVGERLGSEVEAAEHVHRTALARVLDVALVLLADGVQARAGSGGAVVADRARVTTEAGRDERARRWARRSTNIDARGTTERAATARDEGARRAACATRHIARRVSRARGASTARVPPQSVERASIVRWESGDDVAHSWRA